MAIKPKPFTAKTMAKIYTVLLRLEAKQKAEEAGLPEPNLDIKVTCYDRSELETHSQ